MTIQYDRLVAKGFERSGECLITRAPRSTQGYGVISVNKKHHAAHRVAFQKWHGEIPASLVVDHVCHNEAAARGECSGGDRCIHRKCVNPDHLQAKTSLENFRDSPLTGLWNLRGQYLEQCHRGHRFTSENTYTPPSGGSRACKECRRMNVRSYRARRKAS